MPTEYQKKLAKYAANRARMVELHKTGRWTLKEIGLKFNPPVSPQRVRQVLVKEGALS